MIRFIEGQENKVKVSVLSSVDTTGFTVTLALCENTKTIDSIKDGMTTTVVFSSSDVSSVTYEPMLGTVAVMDGNGEVYQEMKVYIQLVKDSNAGSALGYQTLPIVLAANNVGLQEEQQSIAK